MKIRSRLKHCAAGLLARFVSRNNDCQGFWALGLLYSSASAAPWRVEFDLISGNASPRNTITASVVAEQSAFLRAALARQSVALHSLQRAVLTVQFNADVAVGHAGTSGEPFVCVIELGTVTGRCATVSLKGRCAVWRPGRFSPRAGGQFVRF